MQRKESELEFVTFFSDIPDDLPITQAVVDRVKAEGAGKAPGAAGLAQLQVGITGMLSGLMALEREVQALRKTIAGE
ncbi:hypothetical protein A5721_30440 [Mycobacterium vulneris]|nr:hypothetical protein A5721_30440 [Mycolicibacterium vulneris]